MSLHNFTKLWESIFENISMHMYKAIQELLFSAMFLRIAAHKKSGFAENKTSVRNMQRARYSVTCTAMYITNYSTATVYNVLAVPMISFY